MEKQNGVMSDVDIVRAVAKVQTDALATMLFETQKAIGIVETKLKSVQTALARDTFKIGYMQQLAALGYFQPAEVKIPDWAGIAKNISGELAKLRTNEETLKAQQSAIHGLTSLAERAIATVPSGGDLAKRSFESGIVQTVLGHKQMVESILAGLQQVPPTA